MQIVADTMRDRALRLASLGFRVFKLPVASKFPPPEQFYKVATADPSAIRRMWSDGITSESTDNNIGIDTTELLVIDVDVRENKRGNDSLELFASTYDLDTNTLTALTPSGGRHLIYRLPPGRTASGKAHKLGPGLDVRSFHNYIVGVGSVTPEGEYDWYEADTPILQAPDFLVELCQRKEQAPSVQYDLEDDSAHKRAIDWLTNNAPHATEGAGGNETTFRVAAKIKDFGLSQEHAFDLLCDHYNETKCFPRWDLGDLQRIVENAYNYGSNAVGSASALAEFDVVDLATPTSTPPKRLYSISFGEAASTALQHRNQPLIKGLLDHGAMSVLYGNSNVGKTFVAVDMAGHIATGMAWNGRKTEQGLVVYIAAEGGQGARQRLLAFKRKHNLQDKDVKFELIPCPVDLRSNQADVKELRELIAALEAKYGQKIVLLVVDTLSRALAGGDENSSVDMGLFIKNCDRLRAGLNCHLLVVHHSGKDAARGARGWSGIRAAIDTEIEIANQTISTTKQRDLDLIADVRFELEVVTLGTDRDGDAVTSCTVRLLTAAEFESENLSPATQRFWEILHIQIAKNAGLQGLKAEQFNFTRKWIDEIIVQINDGKNPQVEVARQTVDGYLTELTEIGKLKKIKRAQWVINH